MAWGLESRSRRYKQNGPRGGRSLRYINQLSHPDHGETAFYGKPRYQKATSACISTAGQLTRQFNRESFYYKSARYRTVSGCNKRARVRGRRTPERIVTSALVGKDIPLTIEDESA